MKTVYKVIGLMSGTSLDGLDIAYCEFSKTEKWQFKIIESITIEYNKKWKLRLKDCIHFSQSELDELDIDLGKFWGQKVKEFINNKNLEVDFIASHGHTVFHQPEKGITLQIGNAKAISVQTKCTVISDFRTLDVKRGGQGAPLVPIGDKLLFSEYKYCLNLGGISNISFDDENGNRKAFDVLPCNLILNYYANQKNLAYDNNGNLAKSGKLNTKLFDKLNQIEYYRKKTPKSLGKEDIENNFIPLLESFTISLEDKLSTFVEHIGYQIGKELKSGNTLVTGGGAYNSFLVEKISAHSKSTIILGHSALISFKEALIFAFLGVLRSRKEINILKSYTGAFQNSCSGKIITVHQ